ncbi:MAG: recombinase family protein [Bacillota bacterium]
MNIIDLYILYLRKSREDLERERQTGEDVLKTHRERLTDLARTRGLEWKEFAEIESGDTIAGRPVFRQVLNKEIPTGKYRGIIINEISRLGRGDMEDAGKIYKAIVKYNLLIVTPYKTYDPTNRADLRQIRFELFLSREEFELIRERLMDGRDHKAKQGYAPCYLATLGIESYRGRMLIVPEEAALVREIFEMRAEGKSYQEIANILNQRGLKTKRGTQYHHSTVNKILHNRRYIGKAKWRGKEYESQSPAIIPMDLWNLVHDEVNPSRTVTKRTLKEDSPYWVDLYCHECGRRMYGEWVTVDRLLKSGCSKTYNEYGIYICSGKRLPAEERCRHQQRIAYVHDMVLKELRAYTKNRSLIKRLEKERDKRNSVDSAEIERKISEIKKRISELDKFMAKLDNDYKAGTLIAILYGKHYEETVRQKEFAENELASLRAKSQKSNVVLEGMDSIIEKLKKAIETWDDISTPVKKKIISATLPRVEITKDGMLFIVRALPNFLAI